MSWFDVRVAFPSGLVRSYLDFILSYDCRLRARSTSILNTLYQAREMLTMKTSYISHVLMLKLKCVSRDRSMSGNILKCTFCSKTFATRPSVVCQTKNQTESRKNQGDYILQDQTRQNNKTQPKTV